MWTGVVLNGFVFGSIIEWIPEPFTLTSTLIGGVIWMTVVVQMTPQVKRVFNVVISLCAGTCFGCLVWVSTLTGLYPWKFTPNSGMPTFADMWTLVSAVFSGIQLGLATYFL